MAGRATKELTIKEKKFARLIADGLRPQEAARKVFKVKCETKTKTAQKYKDLARSSRVVSEVQRLQTKDKQHAEMETMTLVSQRVDWDNLRSYAFDRLQTIRDDDANPARVRFEALSALEKLQDPAQDLNLIYRWIDLVWGGFTAHCPCCHSDFPLYDVKNVKLTERRLEKGMPMDAINPTEIDRKLYLLSEAERRRTPHPVQLEALSAPERHVVGSGAARAGKSFLLAMFGLLVLLLPGVEIWLLSRTYEDSKSEFEYLEKFLKTLFYPIDHHMYHITFDKKSGEASIHTRWGSLLKIKSSKSQGSITARELEAILVAEPAWVDGDLFEEVRARMSSRLGRILALGTPKGLGGFLARLTRMGNRDMRTGKKLADNARLISNGCSWPQSIVKFNMNPKDNPEYVQSEIETARAELTAREFASEFEGLMVPDENLKFPFITEDNLVAIDRHKLNEARFVLGVDQGEKNFAACLVAWNGREAFVVNEYLDNEDYSNTVKANLIKLNKLVGPLIRRAGGIEDNWKLSIFDADPPIFGQLQEMEEEGRGWKTEQSFRPKNQKDFMNWREETYMWINQLAKQKKLWFAIEDADLLHEQMTEIMVKPRPEGQEDKARGKGWIINDPWRGEHVPDAFVLAMWAIYSNQIPAPEESFEPGDTLQEAQRAFDFQRRVAEEKELQGMTSAKENAIFQEHFGRPRGPMSVPTGMPGYYRDES